MIGKVQKFFSKREKSIGQKLALFAKDRRILAAQAKRPKDFVSKIELIIPCYNHSQYLIQAFESVCAQIDPRPITVTFVDDCSTDNTRVIIKKLSAAKHPSWIKTKTIFNKHNLRQWASLNNAIKQSKNELIMILNDDDLLRPDCLSKTIATYNNHPEIFMLGASSIWLEDGKTPKESKVLPLEKLKLTVHTPDMAHEYKELNDLNMTQSSCSFFKTAWQVAGGYRNKEDRIRVDMNEDRDFQYRVASLLPVGTYNDYPFAYWRIDSSHGQDF